jgi:hypothetical protein
MKYCILLVAFCSFIFNKGQSQVKSSNLVYVDKQGILRYTKTKKEAEFFGVNYTVPFAYGYRSVKRTGVDIEKAIDQDVYHFSRLGLNGFRVHVWDWEITDSLGNLLENEHLRLFDYLLSKLKEYNVKTLITPIAFWGNGYPEKDIPTRSFSNVYGKGPAVVSEKAIQAQENYMKQFFKHVNPFTKLTYKDDPDVIAMEINNEPHHSGPKEMTTEYINRLATSVKGTGWTKPIFYNISESPTYADAVVKAGVEGHSFQWYPTGLVANRTLQGNYLPNVDLYKIPFGDTIAAFKNKTKVVYEFDAGDVLQSNMYPAIARSFRTAGFQWATQFAYDPMATAYANTEYQTHYVNLAYTPAKAISLMIASKVFHSVPRLKSYGTYPADTAFDAFRVSYQNALSEMNDDEAFYYSNTTSSTPKNIANLRHVAGVGSSPIVKYDGTGAYFLDKVTEGVWRMEVMPDAVHIRDPFARASPSKEVTRIQWQANSMHVTLPDLGANFKVSGINEENNYSFTASSHSLMITPGTYLLTNPTNENKWGAYPPTSTAFAAPKQTSFDVYVVHTPFTEVSIGKAFTLTAKIVGLDSTAKTNVEIRNAAGRWRSVPLTRKEGYAYAGQVPADAVVSGVINYRFIIQTSKGFTVFPGNYNGDPYAWDSYATDTYETFVASDNSAIEIFNATTDRNGITIYNADWRNNVVAYTAADKPRQLVMKATINKPTSASIIGFHSYIQDKLKGRQTEVFNAKTLVVRARTTSVMPVKLRLGILTTEAATFASNVTLTNNFQELEVPLQSLKQDSCLLLPRPYPGFLPLWFKSASSKAFTIADADKLEITFGHDLTSSQLASPISVEIESVYLK